VLVVKQCVFEVIYTAEISIGGINKLGRALLDCSVLRHAEPTAGILRDHIICEDEDDDAPPLLDDGVVIVREGNDLENGRLWRGFL